MADILQKLADYARIRTEEAKKNIPLQQMQEEAERLAAEDTSPFRFEKALSGPDISFICEIKQASPSKGQIWTPEQGDTCTSACTSDRHLFKTSVEVCTSDRHLFKFPYLEIAREYEAAGAECISVLTEPKWFKGDGEFLRRITREVNTPCIRKDFTVDEYMIYEAKVLGASAVLLICSILDEDTLSSYIRIADSMGLSSLVEAHDSEEIRMAADAGARMIGVNNRNLKDFTVDVTNSGRLRSLVPDGVLFVAESGIRTAQDVQLLREIGTDACLVGETLMRAVDKSAMLRELRGLNG